MNHGFKGLTIDHDIQTIDINNNKNFLPLLQRKCSVTRKRNEDGGTMYKQWSYKHGNQLFEKYGIEDKTKMTEKSRLTTISNMNNSNHGFGAQVQDSRQAIFTSHYQDQLLSQNPKERSRTQLGKLAISGYQVEMQENDKKRNKEQMTSKYGTGQSFAQRNTISLPGKGVSNIRKSKEKLFNETTQINNKSQLLLSSMNFDQKPEDIRIIKTLRNNTNLNSTQQNQSLTDNALHQADSFFNEDSLNSGDYHGSIEEQLYETHTIGQKPLKTFKRMPPKELKDNTQIYISNQIQIQQINQVPLILRKVASINDKSPACLQTQPNIQVPEVQQVQVVLKKMRVNSREQPDSKGETFLQEDQKDDLQGEYQADMDSINQNKSQLGIANLNENYNTQRSRVGRVNRHKNQIQESNPILHIENEDLYSTKRISSQYDQARTNSNNSVKQRAESSPYETTKTQKFSTCNKMAVTTIEAPYQNNVSPMVRPLKIPQKQPMRKNLKLIKKSQMSDRRVSQLTSKPVPINSTAENKHPQQMTSSSVSKSQLGISQMGQTLQKDASINITATLKKQVKNPAIIDFNNTFQQEEATENTIIENQFKVKSRLYSPSAHTSQRALTQEQELKKYHFAATTTGNFGKIKITNRDEYQINGKRVTQRIKKSTRRENDGVSSMIHRRSNSDNTAREIKEMLLQFQQEKMNDQANATFSSRISHKSNSTLGFNRSQYKFNSMGGFAETLRNFKQKPIPQDTLMVTLQTSQQTNNPEKYMNLQETQNITQIDDLVTEDKRYEPLKKMLKIFSLYHNNELRIILHKWMQFVQISTLQNSQEPSPPQPKLHSNLRTPNKLTRKHQSIINNIQQNQMPSRSGTTMSHAVEQPSSLHPHLDRFNKTNQTVTKYHSIARVISTGNQGLSSSQGQLLQYSSKHKQWNAKMIGVKSNLHHLRKLKGIHIGIRNTNKKLATVGPPTYADPHNFSLLRPTNVEPDSMSTTATTRIAIQQFVPQRIPIQNRKRKMNAAKRTQDAIDQRSQISEFQHDTSLKYGAIDLNNSQQQIQFQKIPEVQDQNIQATLDSEKVSRRDQIAGTTSIGDGFMISDEMTKQARASNGLALGPGTEYIFRSSSYQMNQNLARISHQNEANFERKNQFTHKKASGRNHDIQNHFLNSFDTSGRENTSKFGSAGEFGGGLGRKHKQETNTHQSMESAQIVSVSNPSSPQNNVPPMRVSSKIMTSLDRIVSDTLKDQSKLTQKSIKVSQLDEQSISKTRLNQQTIDSYLNDMLPYIEPKKNSSHSSRISSLLNKNEQQTITNGSNKDPEDNYVLIVNNQSSTPNMIDQMDQANTKTLHMFQDPINSTERIATHPVTQPTVSISQRSEKFEGESDIHEKLVNAEEIEEK